MRAVRVSFRVPMRAGRVRVPLHAFVAVVGVGIRVSDVVLWTRGNLRK